MSFGTVRAPPQGEERELPPRRGWPTHRGRGASRWGPARPEASPLRVPLLRRVWGEPPLAQQARDLRLRLASRPRRTRVREFPSRSAPGARGPRARSYPRPNPHPREHRLRSRARPQALRGGHSARRPAGRAFVPPAIAWDRLRAMAEERVVEIRGAFEAGDEHRRAALRGLLAGRRLQVGPHPERGFRVDGLLEVALERPPARVSGRGDRVVAGGVTHFKTAPPSGGGDACSRSVMRGARY
jgi:hypothetical protein